MNPAARQYPQEFICKATYDFISTGSLYNRSHLIAWSLCGENANRKNLITGTSYLNQGTMTKFEDLVRDYINETGNHVAYRVTPIFIGNNLVCNGVQMEAYSVEDNGEGVCFNVYCYNVQPGVIINYATGESHPENKYDSSSEEPTESSVDTSNEHSSSENETVTYILNTKSKRVHLSTCGSVKTILEENKSEYTGSLDNLISQGYLTCATCIGKTSSDTSSTLIDLILKLLNQEGFALNLFFDFINHNKSVQCGRIQWVSPNILDICTGAICITTGGQYEFWMLFYYFVGERVFILTHGIVDNGQNIWVTRIDFFKAENTTVFICLTEYGWNIFAICIVVPDDIIVAGQ